MDETTIERPITEAELSLLKAHAMNALSVHPMSVDALDKIRLIREIERLRLELIAIRPSSVPPR